MLSTEILTESSNMWRKLKRLAVGRVGWRAERLYK